MKRGLLIFAALLAVCPACSGDAAPFVPAGDPAPASPSWAEETARPVSPPLACDFYDGQSFAAAVERAEIYEIDGLLLCGVVPHHLLADRMIASFFKTAAENRPDVETVVIVAPMHDGTRGKLSTTRSGWRAPGGELPADEAVAARFMEELGAAADDTLLQEDHSASALIPFVQAYFPEAKTACLLISGLSGPDTPRRAAETLSSVAPAQNCLFVFSVDFSHYLTPPETEERDRETRRAVASRDVDSVMRMGNGHMDSPVCVCAFILLTDLLEGSIYELDHGDSLKMSGLHPSDPAFAEGLTSYFIFAGCRPFLS